MPIELLVQDVWRCGGGGVVVGMVWIPENLWIVLVAEAGRLAL